MVADMTMLICVCGLAGTFTTEIVQNGNILTDGNPRAEFELFEEWDVHQFNDDGMQMWNSCPLDQSLGLSEVAAHRALFLW